MSSIPRRLVVLFVASAWLTEPCTAQTPQIIFQSDFATAQKTATTKGLPLMAVVVAKGDKRPAPLTDARVVYQSRSFLNVLLTAEGAQAKKLDDPPAGSVLFLDGEGKTAAQLKPGFSAEQLLEEMKGVVDKARERVLEKFKTEKVAAAQKIALDSYVRLGASLADLVPLLVHATPTVKAAIGTTLTARVTEGADWAVLGAMASPDADVRAASYSLAVSLNRAAKVPPLTFWKEASEEERTIALMKWRSAIYGEVPQVNKAILDFAFANFGKQVDNGECAMLAVEALKAAKGQPIKIQDKSYSWGHALAAGETALVGDIVQMQGATFSTGVMAPQHTTIIRRVIGPGRYEILEQNVGGRRTVGPGRLDMKTLRQGTITIYRPQPIEVENK